MKTILCTFLSMIALVSCQNSQGVENLTLNQGQKWTVNEEMKPHIMEGMNVLNQYVQNNSDDHRALASQLKQHNQSLIKSCTMKGKSHDELHKWLHPHMALIESLSKAETNEEAQRIVSELRQSFETYKKYFN